LRSFGEVTGTLTILPLRIEVGEAGRADSAEAAARISAVLKKIHAAFKFE